VVGSYHVSIFFLPSPQNIPNKKKINTRLSSAWVSLIPNNMIDTITIIEVRDSLENPIFLLKTT
jgi:hypothetical protein